MAMASKRRSAIGFFTKKKGKHRQVRPITAKSPRPRSHKRPTRLRISGRSKAKPGKPLSYFAKKAEIIRPAPKPKPKPVPKVQKKVPKKVTSRVQPRVQKQEKPSKSVLPKSNPQPQPKPESRHHKRLIIKRNSGGVLPRSLAEEIMLKRMVAAYPDIDAATVTNEMMDNYDQTLSFNENMNAMSKLDQFQAYPAALEYRKDWEGRYEAPQSEVDAREKDAIYKEIDSRLKDILERYPEDFQDYLADRGLAEVKDS